VRLDAARRQSAPDPRARKALVARRCGGRPGPSARPATRRSY